MIERLDVNIACSSVLVFSLALPPSLMSKQRATFDRDTNSASLAHYCSLACMPANESKCKREPIWRRCKPPRQQQYAWDGES